MVKNRQVNFLLSILIGIFHYLYLFVGKRKYLYLGNYEVTEKTPAILACWHENAFISLSLKKPKKISILVSRSKDGDLARGITLINGWRSVRGSSSKGGEEALKEYCEFLRQNPAYSVGVTVDGPRGPRHRPKRGVFEMAKSSGMPVVPFLPVAKKNKILGTWDKMKIPRVFQTYYFLFGEPIYISPAHQDPKYEKERELLSQRLHDLQDHFDQKIH